MNDHPNILQGNGMRCKFTSLGLRMGIAKDKLIFIIICSAAMAVAILALLHFFVGSTKITATEWQCLKCNYEFSKKTTEMPPIDCPKCGGPAARLNYRICPECKKEILVSRMRLTEQGQAQRQQTKAAGSQQGGADPGPGFAMMAMPMEIQFSVKQADSSYGWTPWIPAFSPQAQQFNLALRCPECGAGLSSLSPRQH